MFGQAHTAHMCVPATRQISGLELVSEITKGSGRTVKLKLSIGVLEQ